MFLRDRLCGPVVCLDNGSSYVYTTVPNHAERDAAWEPDDAWGPDATRSYYNYFGLGQSLSEPAGTTHERIVQACS